MKQQNRQKRAFTKLPLMTNGFMIGSRQLFAPKSFAKEHSVKRGACHPIYLKCFKFSSLKILFLDVWDNEMATLKSIGKVLFTRDPTTEVILGVLCLFSLEMELFVTKEGTFSFIKSLALSMSPYSPIGSWPWPWVCFGRQARQAKSNITTIRVLPQDLIFDLLKWTIFGISYWQLGGSRNPTNDYVKNGICPKLL